MHIQNLAYDELFDELRLEHHLVDMLVKLTILGQLVGCLMVLFRRKIKTGCGIILLIKISQVIDFFSVLLFKCLCSWCSNIDTVNVK